MTDRRDGDGEGRTRSRQGAAYQGAFEAVFAILIAVFAGKFADDHFGTTPRYLLVGFVIGFFSFVLRLVRLGRHLQTTASEEELEDQ
jgi:F0F1-type ATP synthase assembly protein I